jgi:ABC-2 type transport system permease protein
MIMPLELHSGIARPLGSNHAAHAALFFASNALYPIDAFPPIMRFLSMLNPLTYLINGVRYFAIGSHFYAMGSFYIYTERDIIFSLFYLSAFAVLMFFVARRIFDKAVVT